MRHRNLKLFSLILALIFQLHLAGCGSETHTANTFPVVVFSDVHFDPFYDPSPSIFQALVAADATGWADIFKTSGIVTPSVWGNDTNYPLLVLALSSIRQNLGASPLIIFTGDILGHDFAQLFYTQYYWPQSVPSVPGPAAVAAMQAFAGKTVTFFAQQVRSSVGNIPVMFVVGNNDSYADLGPDSTFLASTAEPFYKNFVNGTVDHQVFLDTFKAGGYYSAEVPGRNLTVIGLNTVMFSPLIPLDTGAVNAELAWLDSTLAQAKTAGKKVWLLMHEPPGANILATFPTIDAGGHIATFPTIMMWNQDYQASFLQILSKYPGVISLTLGGHTHMDEYRILSSSSIIEITPSISPRSSNNPAFRVFTFSHDTFKPTDYKTLSCDLSTNPLQFKSYYDFSTAYFVQGLLDDSLAQLFPALVTDNTKQALYREHYFSGHNSPAYITDANWPVFWCGIDHMDKQGFIDCVNAY